MANITVTTNQQVIDVTTSGGVNVTNTTDVITVLPSGTLIIQSPDTYSINASTVAGGANLNLLNSNGTNDAVKFASGAGITVSRTDADTITVTNTSPAGTTYTQNATAVTGGANLNLVGSDATTDTVKFASGTNVTVSRTDADTITIASIDTNTTYTQNASSVAGGANLNLVGSDSTVDSVKFASGTNVTVSRTDADTITIASTDTNTTYDFNATSATGGANLNLVGSDSTTDTVKLTNGGHITATYSSGTAVTLGSDATDANTVSTIVARDASGNFSAGTITANSVAVAYNGASGSTGSLNVGGALNGVTDTNIITSLVGTSSTYAYAALQNKTTSAASYGAYSLYNDLGSVYGELGMTSSTYNYASAGFPDNAFSTPNTTFLQSGPGSELTIGTNGSNSIHFVTNGGTQTTEAMTISPTNAVTMAGTLGVTGAATAGTLSRVLGQQINTRNSTYTPPTIPLTAVTGLNGLAVASSTGGYFPDISVNNYLGDVSASNIGAGVSLRSTSGTSASPTGTANNQIMGTVNFDGWATGTNANWASYNSTVAGGTGGGVSYVYPLQAQAYARQAFTNGTVSTAVTGASGNGTTATLTFAQLNVQTYFAGGVITVAGMTPSGYNGTYTITAATTTSVSYLNATTGFTSGGTISLPVVSAAGTGYRIRGFQTSTPLIGANRINFADFNASSTTFKSAAYTFINEVIPGATQTATNYLTLGTTGGTFNNDLFVRGGFGTNSVLSTGNGVTFMTAPYTGTPGVGGFAFPGRLTNKRLDTTTVPDGESVGLQYQAFGSGSSFVNIGSQSMVYKTNGNNEVTFILDNNAGASTSPITISAPVTTIRAGTNTSVSDVATFTTANTTLKADALTLQTTAGAALVGNQISYNRVYGAFQYNTTVTPAAANTAYVFPIGTTDFANIVSVGSTSRIILGAAGIYNLQFSVQVENTVNAEHVAYIWLRKNGVDVTASMGRINIPKSGATISGWNYYIDSANTTDYYEIAYAVNDTAVIFPTYAATSFGPSTASLITTITPVGA